MWYKRFPLGPLWTNGYLFRDINREAFFVDPGGDPSQVIEEIRKEGIILRDILLTHGHVDHILGIESLVEYSGATVHIHELDISRLTDPSENLSDWMGDGFSPHTDAKGFVDNAIIGIGRFTVEVIHTPGHTPGSSCFLVSSGNDQALVSGDTLFARSVGRTDLPGGNWEELKRSLLKLIDLPETLVVLPGHGPETTLAEEKRHNPFWPV